MSGVEHLAPAGVLRVREMPPRTWLVIFGEVTRPEWWCLLVCCPSGHRSVARHAILDDGGLVPSVACPLCDWHCTAALDGWVRPSRRDHLRALGFSDERAESLMRDRGEMS